MKLKSALSDSPEITYIKTRGVKRVKRLKGLLQLGYLPKNDPQSARAWLELKLLLALVIEKLCYDARFFSPWGYRLEFQSLGGVAGNDRRGADEPTLPAVAT